VKRTIQVRSCDPPVVRIRFDCRGGARHPRVTGAWLCDDFKPASTRVSPSSAGAALQIAR